VYGGEIICCGGAINSPQLLQLSGIGNAEHLANSASMWSHDLPA
jgi:choline dehydrogenase